MAWLLRILIAAYSAAGLEMENTGLTGLAVTYSFP